MGRREIKKEEEMTRGEMIRDSSGAKEKEEALFFSSSSSSSSPRLFKAAKVIQVELFKRGVQAPRWKCYTWAQI